MTNQISKDLYSSNTDLCHEWEYKETTKHQKAPTAQVKVSRRLKQERATMSKILVALMVVTIAVVAQGCSDSCRGRRPGISYPSYCGPCNRYYVCIGVKIIYRYCSRNNQCLIKGVCGQCQDQCAGKPNGDYQSLDNPRPFYYHCQNGHLSYRTCHPNEVFNAWTRQCECYEVFCEKGDGYQPSVCGNGGCSGYVECEGGFAKIRLRCPRPRPYFCCRRQEREREMQQMGTTTTLPSDDIVPSLRAASSVFIDRNHKIMHAFNRCSDSQFSVAMCTCSCLYT
ncbi:hypothetical protein LSAT2_002533 [Lamellibrachia satsuma]|nr:hypothetical protein LSAT2_002533 [Lamellibrachia satsuma]